MIALATLFIAPPIVAKVPKPDSIEAGARVRFLNRRRNVEAARLGYSDLDFITKINGQPIESVASLTPLCWTARARADSQLTVVTSAGLTLTRSAPPSWDGLTMRAENILVRRYAQHYAAFHGDDWDDLVIAALNDYDIGKYANAEVGFTKALRAGASDPLTTMTLGLLAQRDYGRWRPPRLGDSLRHLTSAHDYFAGNSSKDIATRAEVSAALGAYYEQKNLREKAIEHYEEAYSWDKANPTVIERLDALYLDKGLPGNRLDLVSQCLIRYPRHPTFWDAKGEILKTLGRNIEVKALYSERARLAPDDFAAQRKLLDHLVAEKEWKDWMKEADAVLARLGPTLPEADAMSLKSSYCEYSREAGKEKKALPYARELAQERGAADDHKFLALILTDLGDWRGAAIAFNAYEEKASRGDYHQRKLARLAVREDLDKVVMELNDLQLKEYGYARRKQQIQWTIEDNKEGYLLLRKYAPLVARILMWGGIAFIVFAAGRRYYRRKHYS